MTDEKKFTPPRTAYEVAAMLLNPNAFPGFAQVVGEALLHYKVTALAGKSEAEKHGDLELSTLCNNRYSEAKAALEFMANCGWDKCPLPACDICNKEPNHIDTSTGFSVCADCGCENKVLRTHLPYAP